MNLDNLIKGVLQETAESKYSEIKSQLESYKENGFINRDINIEDKKALKHILKLHGEIENELLKTMSAFQTIKNNYSNRNLENLFRLEAEFKQKYNREYNDKEELNRFAEERYKETNDRFMLLVQITDRVIKEHAYYNEAYRNAKISIVSKITQSLMNVWEKNLQVFTNTKNGGASAVIKKIDDLDNLIKGVLQETAEGKYSEIKSQLESYKKNGFINGDINIEDKNALKQILRMYEETESELIKSKLICQVNKSFYSNKSLENLFRLEAEFKQKFNREYNNIEELNRFAEERYKETDDQFELLVQITDRVTNEHANYNEAYKNAKAGIAGEIAQMFTNVLEKNLKVFTKNKINENLNSSATEDAQTNSLNAESKNPVEVKGYNQVSEKLRKITVLKQSINALLESKNSAISSQLESYVQNGILKNDFRKVDKNEARQLAEMYGEIEKDLAINKLICQSRIIVYSKMTLENAFQLDVEFNKKYNRQYNNNDELKQFAEMRYNETFAQLELLVKVTNRIIDELAICNRAYTKAESESLGKFADKLALILNNAFSKKDSKENIENVTYYYNPLYNAEIVQTEKIAENAEAIEAIKPIKPIADQEITGKRDRSREEVIDEACSNVGFTRGTAPTEGNNCLLYSVWSVMEHADGITTDNTAREKWVMDLRKIAVECGFSREEMLDVGDAWHSETPEYKLRERLQGKLQNKILKIWVYYNGSTELVHAATLTGNEVTRDNSVEIDILLDNGALHYVPLFPLHNQLNIRRLHNDNTSQNPEKNSEPVFPKNNEKIDNTANMDVTAQGDVSGSYRSAQSDVSGSYRSAQGDVSRSYRSAQSDANGSYRSAHGDASGSYRSAHGDASGSYRSALSDVNKNFKKAEKDERSVDPVFDHSKGSSPGNETYDNVKTTVVGKIYSKIKEIVVFWKGPKQKITALEEQIRRFIKVWDVFDQKYSKYNLDENIDERMKRHINKLWNIDEKNYSEINKELQSYLREGIVNSKFDKKDKKDIEQIRYSYLRVLKTLGEKRNDLGSAIDNRKSKEKLTEEYQAQIVVLEIKEKMKMLDKIENKMIGELIIFNKLLKKKDVGKENRKNAEINDLENQINSFIKVWNSEDQEYLESKDHLKSFISKGGLPADNKDNSKQNKNSYKKLAKKLGIERNCLAYVRDYCKERDKFYLNKLYDLDQNDIFEKIYKTKIAHFKRLYKEVEAKLTLLEEIEVKVGGTKDNDGYKNKYENENNDDNEYNDERYELQAMARDLKSLRLEKIGIEKSPISLGIEIPFEKIEDVLNEKAEHRTVEEVNDKYEEIKSRQSFLQYKYYLLMLKKASENVFNSNYKFIKNNVFNDFAQRTVLFGASTSIKLIRGGVPNKIEDKKRVTDIEQACEKKNLKRYQVPGIDNNCLIESIVKGIQNVNDMKVNDHQISVLEEANWVSELRDEAVSIGFDRTGLLGISSVGGRPDFKLRKLLIDNLDSYVLNIWIYDEVRKGIYRKDIVKGINADKDGKTPVYINILFDNLHFDPLFKKNANGKNTFRKLTFKIKEKLFFWQDQYEKEIKGLEEKIKRNVNLWYVTEKKARIDAGALRNHNKLETYLRDGIIDGNFNPKNQERIEQIRYNYLRVLKTLEEKRRYLALLISYKKSSDDLIDQYKAQLGLREIKDKLKQFDQIEAKINSELAICNKLLEKKGTGEENGKNAEINDLEDQISKLVRVWNPKDQEYLGLKNILENYISNGDFNKKNKNNYKKLIKKLGKEREALASIRDYCKEEKDFYLEKIDNLDQNNITSKLYDVRIEHFEGFLNLANEKLKLLDEIAAKMNVKANVKKDTKKEKKRKKRKH